jgi:hypothetical protein
VAIVVCNITEWFLDIRSSAAGKLKLRAHGISDRKVYCEIDFYDRDLEPAFIKQKIFDDWVGRQFSHYEALLKIIDHRGDELAGLFIGWTDENKALCYYFGVGCSKTAIEILLTRSSNQAIKTLCQFQIDLFFEEAKSGGATFLSDFSISQRLKCESDF